MLAVAAVVALAVSVNALFKDMSAQSSFASFSTVLNVRYTYDIGMIDLDGDDVEEILATRSNTLARTPLNKLSVGLGGDDRPVH